MNKHIELVKKWLANPDSVSLEELKDNYDAAKAVYDAAAATYDAAYTANAAVDAAEHGVIRYEELKE